MKNLYLLSTFSLLAISGPGVSAATVAPGDDLYIPPGLAPGDTYQLIFLTESTTDATSTDIATYNLFVQTEADSAARTAGISWSIVGSTATVDARDNAVLNSGSPDFVGLYTLDGTKVANNAADLWDGVLPTWIDLTQNLVQRDQQRMWSGTNADGTGAGASALGGTSTVKYGYTGNVTIPDSRWIAAGDDPNSGARRVYALSEEITLIPEPASVWLLVMAVLGLAGRRKRTAANRC